MGQLAAQLALAAGGFVLMWLAGWVYYVGLVGPPVDPPVEPPQETDSGSPEEPGTAAATLPAESLGFLEELAYPLFAVDGENRILVWNQRMVELLRISALAVLGIDFSKRAFCDAEEMPKVARCLARRTLCNI